jgi:photosystem II stability/assembly factor-like uncharacterized protein
MGIDGGFQGVLSIACTRGSACVGVSTDPLGANAPLAPGEDIVSQDRGKTWTNESASLSPATFTIQSVACGGSTSCMSVGPGDTTSNPIVVITSDDGGTTWSAANAPTKFFAYPAVSGTLPSAPSLNVACSSAATCIVVGFSGSRPLIERTHNDGATWTTSSVQ